MFRFDAVRSRSLRFSSTVLVLTLISLLAPIAARAQAPGTCDGMSLGTTATTGTVGGDLNGFVPFPADDPWNTNISNAPVDPNSAAIVATWSTTILGFTIPDTFTAEFGAATNANNGVPDNGIPYIVVDSTQTPSQPITVTTHAAQGDVVVAPFPSTAGGVPIEGAPEDCAGWPNAPASTNQAIVLDRAGCWAYELYGATSCNGQYESARETIWDLTNDESRPWGWISSDTAGLPIFPGLVRYDEASSGAINHAIAIEMTPTNGDSHDGYYVLPASYSATTTATAHTLPMGARLRLNPTTNISGLSAINQAIATAMMTYGLIVTDNTNNFGIEGTPDARWDDTDLGTFGIDGLLGTAPNATNLQVIQMSPSYPGLDNNTAYTSSNPEYAAGHTAPVINSFSADGRTGLYTVEPGTLVTFDYTVTGASYVYIDLIGPVRLTGDSGSTAITATTTETYTLYATNAWGRTSATMEINVDNSVVTPPIFNPSPAQTGILNAAQKVTISTPTSPTATIYYTTDGSTPTTASTLYSGFVTVLANCATTHTGTETLEAIAEVADYAAPSAASTATYTCGGKTATPVFSPPAGTYDGTQTVTISDSTAASSIYYTTDGTTPTTASTLYSAALTVATTQTIEALATSAGNSNSTIATARYTINPPAAATPTFAPPAGTYTSVQTVTISDATPSSTIYYTTGFGTPTTNSTLYTGPLTIGVTTTIKAIAVAASFSNSAVASATYTINLPAAATPTFAPPAGTYTSIQTVTISDTTPSSTIYYTTGAGTPTTNSTLYTGPITVGVTTTFKAIAVASGLSNSAVGTATYTINLPAAATPVFNPATGSYTSTQTVTISDATGGTSIYYTVTAGATGTAPTTNSTLYAGPITVANTEVIEAIAVETGYSNSTVGTGKYTITDGTTVATPGFAPPAGTYTSIQTVTISDSTASSAIYYTTDGTTPVYPVGGTTRLYSGPLIISATTTVKAIGQLTGDNNSAVATAVYVINLPAAPAPVFSPPAGTYTTSQTVTISDSNGTAALYYTTNGTAPTTASTPYTIPIPIAATLTLRALAVVSGDANSTTSGVYTINDVTATPTFSPAANFPYISPFTAPQTVTISDATAGATIYYTTDGTTPTTASATYSGPFTIYTSVPEGSVEVEALAAKSGLVNSTVGTVTYYFDISAVSSPSFSPGTGVYSGAQTVTISDATAGVTIYYTVTSGTTGTTPTTASATYSVPILVTPASVVEAFAAKTGYANSAVVQATYSTESAAPTPTFNPPAGSYANAQSIAIGDSAAGSTIYYTTNGSTPTTASARYTVPIYIVGTANPTTLEAIATAPDYSTSSVGIAVYNIPTPPTLTIPAPGTVLPGTSVTFGWTPGSAATHFELWLGSNGAGTSNLYNSGSITGTTTTAGNLPDNGETVYARLYYLIYGAWYEEDYTYTAAGSPIYPAISSPTPSTTLTSTSEAFTWTTGNIATEYQLLVGTGGAGASNLYASGPVTVTTETVNDLPSNGGTVNVRLFYLVTGVWEYTDYTYTAEGAVVLPSLTTPTPNTTTPLTGTSVTFGWNPGNTATHFEFWLGSNGPGTSNIYNSGSVTATSETVTGLPSNGETLYARLYYLMNGSWSSISYTYVASGSPTLATLTIPTPSSKLGGTSVNFSWNPGNVATHFELLLGSTGLGSSNLYASGSVTVTTEDVTGLPDNGEEIYARLYSLINGTWEYNDYTYTAAGTVVQPSLTTPTPNTSTPLTGTSVTFDWNPGNLATQFQFDIGNSSGVILYSSGTVTATSETVSGLPSNGETITARLYYLENGAWDYKTYTYVSTGSPTPAVLTTPTPDTTTPLSGSSVAFSWTPGNTATHFELWVGPNIGGSSIYNSGSVTTTTETVTDLPTNGSKVWVRLWYLINGVWEYTDYTYISQ